jgi:CubicO group peptidase (beta-lactamase class C family)
MDQWRELAATRLKEQNFDFLSFALIDFKRQSFEGFDLSKTGELSYAPIYDLASLTKPLTLSFAALRHPKLFTNQYHQSLLHHRAGLPSGGRLSKQSWKSTLMDYTLQSDQAELYSDYSALRLMLEIEALSGQDLYSLSRPWWDKEIVHWTQIDQPFHCPPTGFRSGAVIQGQVHDDNAFVIQRELSHAGLFGSLSGVCKSLLQLSESLPTLLKATEAIDPSLRFVQGFDRVTDPLTTLAGPGSSKHTIGHLGFTGTSFWIDLKKRKGWVLLTNATQRYWYSRDQLQSLRRELGALVWARS